MRSKALADVVEAIMGAALLSGGTDVALKAAKALNLPLPGIEEWSDFGQRVEKVFEPVLVQIPSSTIKAVEAVIGCQFERPQFLVQALVRAFYTGAATVVDFGRPDSYLENRCPFNNIRASRVHRGCNIGF